MKKTLWGIALAFGLALLFTGLKNEYARFLPGGDYGMSPLVETGGAQHVFIGSSMFRQGLDIRILEEELGESVYVLSYNGNQPLFYGHGASVSSGGGGGDLPSVC